MGLAGLRLAQSLADLQVELHEAGAGLRQVPARTHHGEAARLAQRLVTEVDVQEGLDRVVRLVAEDVVGPQGPAEGGGRRRPEVSGGEQGIMLRSMTLFQACYLHDPLL